MNKKLIDGNGPVNAAKNIRLELKVNFPGVEFSVKTKCYSMGNSITIRYQNGPAVKEIERITSRYEAGSFDGMTDCYNYDVRPFTERFGSAKHIFIERSFSDDVIGRAIKEAQEARGWANKNTPTIDDYKNGHLHNWNVQWNGAWYDLQSETHQVLSRMGAI